MNLIFLLVVQKFHLFFNVHLKAVSYFLVWFGNFNLCEGTIKAYFYVILFSPTRILQFLHNFCN